MTDEERLAAEQRARVLIDRQLTEAGWVVQDRKDLNLFAGQGVAVREVIMAKGHGRADYLLYVDQKAVGVIEAKPAGTTLSGVEWQSAMYAEGLPGKPRSERVESEQCKSFSYDELMARDKANLDITWLRDETLEDLDNLPAPEFIAREIVEDLTAALVEFEAVAAALEERAGVE
jgi:type I restriction enzyme R subunit